MHHNNIVIHIVQSSSIGDKCTANSSEPVQIKGKYYDSCEINFPPQFCYLCMGDQPTIHLQFIHSTTTQRSFSWLAGTASSSLQNKLQGVAPLGNRYAHDDEGRKELAWFVSSSLYNFPESTTRLFRHPTNDVPLGSPGPAASL